MPIVAPPVVIQKKRGLGCFGCGCIVLVIIGILLVVLAIFGGRQAYSAAYGLTSAAPTAIPVTDAGEPVYQSARQKIATLQQAFTNVQPASVHLTADEINTLIARDPAYAKARGHVHVAFQGSDARLQSSILLGDFEKTIMTDRYLNSIATTGVDFDAATHQVTLNITSVQLNGQDVPASAYAGINQGLNAQLNAQLQSNQLSRDFLARVQKLSIENNELVIELK